MAGCEFDANNGERWLQSSLLNCVPMPCHNKQNFFLETACVFKRQILHRNIRMNDNWYNRLNYWYKYFFFPSWIRIPQDDRQGLVIYSCKHILLRTCKVLQFASKEKVSSMILHLRLFCLERFVTCWAVKVIIKLSILGLITIFTYERKPMVRILFG